MGKLFGVYPNTNFPKNGGAMFVRHSNDGKDEENRIRAAFHNFPILMASAGYGRYLKWLESKHGASGNFVHPDADICGGETLLLFRATRAVLRTLVEVFGIDITFMSTNKSISESEEGLFAGYEAAVAKYLEQSSQSRARKIQQQRKYCQGTAENKNKNSNNDNETDHNKAIGVSEGKRVVKAMEEDLRRRGYRGWRRIHRAGDIEICQYLGRHNHSQDGTSPPFAFVLSNDSDFVLSNHGVPCALADVTFPWEFLFDVAAAVDARTFTEAQLQFPILTHTSWCRLNGQEPFPHLQIGAQLVVDGTLIPDGLAPPPRLKLYDAFLSDSEGMGKSLTVFLAAGVCGTEKVSDSHITKSLVYEQFMKLKDLPSVDAPLDFGSICDRLNEARRLVREDNNKDVKDALYDLLDFPNLAKSTQKFIDSCCFCPHKTKETSDNVEEVEEAGEKSRRKGLQLQALDLPDGVRTKVAGRDELQRLYCAYKRGYFTDHGPFLDLLYGTPSFSMSSKDLETKREVDRCYPNPFRSFRIGETRLFCDFYQLATTKRSSRVFEYLIEAQRRHSLAFAEEGSDAIVCRNSDNELRAQIKLDVAMDFKAPAVRLYNVFADDDAQISQEQRIELYLRIFDHRCHTTKDIIDGPPSGKPYKAGFTPNALEAVLWFMYPYLEEREVYVVAAFFTILATAGEEQQVDLTKALFDATPSRRPHARVHELSHLIPCAALYVRLLIHFLYVKTWHYGRYLGKDDDQRATPDGVNDGAPEGSEDSDDPLLSPGTISLHYSASLLIYLYDQAPALKDAYDEKDGPAVFDFLKASTVYRALIDNVTKSIRSFNSDWQHRYGTDCVNRYFRPLNASEEWVSRRHDDRASGRGRGDANGRGRGDANGRGRGNFNGPNSDAFRLPSPESDNNESRTAWRANNVSGSRNLPAQTSTGLRQQTNTTGMGPPAGPNSIVDSMVNQHPPMQGQHSRDSTIGSWAGRRGNGNGRGRGYHT